MTLFVHFDKADHRFTVADGLHSIHDLTSAEYADLMNDFASGAHSAEQVFDAAARRHAEVTR